MIGADRVTKNAIMAAAASMMAAAISSDGSVVEDLFGACRNIPRGMMDGAESNREHRIRAILELTYEMAEKIAKWDPKGHKIQGDSTG